MFWKKFVITLFIFILILLYRAYVVFTPDKTIFEPCSSTNDNHSLEFHEQRLRTFQTLLQFQTISYEENNQNFTELKHCRNFIKQHYDDLITKYSKFVQLHDIAEYSLLYEIRGKNSNLKPFLLSAHFDVVPTGNLSRWKYPPFDGHSDGQFIYARGTLDDKGSVFTMMEALKEYLNVHGQPSRTFYIGLTHDEEVGRAGAMGIAKYLSKQPFGHDGQFEFVLDEGTIILEEAFPTLHNPIAIIGVAEKGYMTIEYSISLPPGHSSMPTAPTAIGILARAVDKLESTLQPSQFGRGPEISLLHSITPYLKFPLRLALSNIWLFGYLIQLALAQKPGTNALQRTTSAVTLISGGEKENILPTSASATINHRIHTADSCQKILENNRRIINDDRIVPRVKNCVEPSPSSPYGKDVYSYRIIEQTIRQTFDKDRQPIIVVPGLMLGATDSRSYTNLSKNLYRFSPFIYHHDDLDRLHGDNERMTHLDVQRGLNFYFHLIVNNQLGHIPESKLNTEL
ncbi:unnamed protein product [Rotaria socialis]|uniref:Peptidase M20 dimerisation domain-containing protein n=5 Tax=Rotaria socialis TaxID=392032 RepID=A0A821M0S6_9BILA|nr:unnamed protein product [Rotaria socialis]CAF4758931.1 unnamed protein product [Rotaria socialis]